MKPAGLTGILYLRVSSDDQVRGVSLDDQEAAGREWFLRRGVELLEVFREEGKSAKDTTRRTELHRALAFVEDRVMRQRGALTFFLVYDLSRFARSMHDQVVIGAKLKAWGVRLSSVAMEFEDNASGRYTMNIMGATNQFTNELQGEKITRCMQETARRGGWPWSAPLGYVNGRAADGSKTVRPDAATAPLVRMAFELIARGVGPGEALLKVTTLGLRSRHGRVVRAQEFRKMLANPFYSGRVSSPAWSIDVAGKHEPIIDEALWRRTQLVVSGRFRPQRDNVASRPEFPLRGFVRCGACGHPLTASLSTGKGGRRYPYYHCWWRACEGVNIAAPRLEAELVAAMKRIEIPPAVLRLVEEHLRDVWTERTGEADRLRLAARRRISELLARRETLVETFACDRSIDRDTYQRLRSRIDADLTRAELEHQSTELDRDDFEDILRHANRVLSDASTLWQSFDALRRRALQELMFPEGVTYSAGSLGTPATNAIYGLLVTRQSMKDDLVEQIRSTWNTLLGFCRASAGLFRVPIGLEVGLATPTT